MGSCTFILVVTVWRQDLNQQIKTWFSHEKVWTQRNIVLNMESYFSDMRPEASVEIIKWNLMGSHCLFFCQNVAWFSLTCRTIFFSFPRKGNQKFPSVLVCFLCSLLLLQGWEQTHGGGSAAGTATKGPLEGFHQEVNKLTGGIQRACTDIKQFALIKKMSAAWKMDCLVLLLRAVTADFSLQKKKKKNSSYLHPYVCVFVHEVILSLIIACRA